MPARPIDTKEFSEDIEALFLQDMGKNPSPGDSFIMSSYLIISVLKTRGFVFSTSEFCEAIGFLMLRKIVTLGRLSSVDEDPDVVTVDIEYKVPSKK